MSDLKLARENRNRLVSIGAYVFPPFFVSLVSYLLSPNEILWVQFVFALLLLQIPWMFYVSWRKRAEEKLPVFALISFIYWIYYVLSLFWGARTISSTDSPFGKLVSQESITWSLALAVTGVSAIWLGMRVRLGQRMVPKKLPELKPGLHAVHYLRLLLVAGTLLSLSESFPYMAGEGGRQVLTIIISTVPILAFAILFRNILVGQAQPLDKLFVLGFLVLQLVIGLSSGWLGSFAGIIVVCAAIYLAEKRRIPQFALILAICFTLFFQVGKQEFRRVYWYGDTQTSKIDRVKFWTEASLHGWQDAVSDSTGGALADAINSTFSRVSLLTQTANVVDLTPSTIPYQGGQMYSYLLVTWIPRALWPEKPSVSEANRFYQVAYGLSTEEGLETVAIGVGMMTEAYISFGWIGVVGIMFLLGIFYDVFRSMFFRNASGVLMTAMGIALLPRIINGEAQMAVYVGGIVQQIVFTLLIFSPIIRWRPLQPSPGLSSCPENVIANGRISFR
jgi:hypothetical protein